jgi:hypothetical protein
VKEFSNAMSGVRKMGVINNPLQGVDRRLSLRAARGKYWASTLSGKLEDSFRLKHLAAIHHRQRVDVLVSYFRVSPETAKNSKWAEEEVLKLWRMGDDYSLQGIAQIIAYRRKKPRPMRERLRRARVCVQLNLYDQILPDLTSEYASIKVWVADRRREEPAITRKRLWECWNQERFIRPGSPPIIDWHHFEKLTNRRSKPGSRTPSYLARSYLRKFLRLPDHLVSRRSMRNTTLRERAY